MRNRILLVLSAAIIASLGLSGCKDLFNALTDSAAPTGLSASDGDYANTIQVSWGAPSLSSDKWQGYEIQGYLVTWDGPTANPGMVYGTSCSIPIDPTHRAIKYTVTVETRFKPGSAILSGGSASDDGFALDTESLVWYDGGSNYTMAGTDRWYVTMLQKGFTYSFVFPSAAGTVDFYNYKTLDSAHSSAPAATSQSWTCNENGTGHKFYVHVTPGSPDLSFHASYGF